MFINIIKSKLRDKSFQATMWYILGSFFVQGINFITVPIFTRMLSTENYGTISLYNTSVSVVNIIISLDLVACVIRGRYDFEEDYNKFLSANLFLSTLSFLVGILIAFIGKNYIAILTGVPKELIVMLFIQSYFLFVINFISAKYTGKTEYKKFVGISISSSVLNVSLSIILISLFTKDKYLGRIYGGFIITSLLGVIIYLRIMLKGKTLINIKYWKYGLMLSLPLIPHSLSSIVLTQADRLMINYYFGKDATGIYSFSYSVGMIINILYMSLSKVWTPWFYNHMKKNNFMVIKDKAKDYILLFSSIVALMIFVSPELVKIMASKDYWEGIILIPAIMLSYFFVFLYNLVGNIEFYMKKTYYTSIGTFSCGAINIVLNIIFLPRYGYQAAAWTTLISYIFLFIFHYIIAVYILKQKVFSDKYFIIGISIVLIATILFYILKEYYYIRYIIILILIYPLWIYIKPKLVKKL